ncbi:phosphotransferase [Shimia aestuarii]|uniref:tRNA A-37 threonylcarbamoyl transferase component Bud32 n=1 Tax=Shimia aestuarii TaxID=254406 RepID=A0A1I4TCF6_9RHOB|nr:phosphotransferase [Shimia aestuarii]SFM74335.1 tRNA A-37 threonylcarbamoyl transferase component Bud32 [Shimia aestuarii]
MENNPASSVRDALCQLAEARGATGAPRIERVELEGRVYWIKRPEVLSWRYRLQKGDPRAAFERERRAFHEMNAVNAPVPRIQAEGPDFLVLPDCGTDLRRRFRDEDDDGKRKALLCDAAQALGRFHTLGFTHGRPSPKDMCLAKDGILMLDFERYREENNTPRGHARDLVVFAFNVIAYSPRAKQDLPEAMQTYRENAPDGTWELAQEWLARLRWVSWLAIPGQWRRGKKGKEFKAVPQLFELFRDA